MKNIPIADISTQTLASSPEVNVGNRLRQLRLEIGLSLRGLADKSGLNVNTLSLIENGHSSPSVSTLQMIAQALRVPLNAFFENDHGDKQLVYHKHGQSPRVAFAHGEMDDLAAGMPRFGAEPLIITLNPHADSGKIPIVHTGREFVYCLTGQISYTVEEQVYLLEPGDSLLFEAYLPHRWRNHGETESRFLLVLCPMDQRDQPSERHFGR